MCLSFCGKWYLSVHRFDWKHILMSHFHWISDSIYFSDYTFDSHEALWVCNDESVWLSSRFMATTSCRDFLGHYHVIDTKLCMVIIGIELCPYHTSFVDFDLISRSQQYQINWNINIYIYIYICISVSSHPIKFKLCWFITHLNKITYMVVFVTWVCIEGESVMSFLLCRNL